MSAEGHIEEALADCVVPFICADFVLVQYNARIPRDASVNT